MKTMKSILFMGLSILLMASCEQKATRYTQESAEIDTYKKAIDNYNNKTYDTSIYADTSKTYFNTIDKGMSPEDVVKYHEQNDTNYTQRGFEKEGQEYEMVTDDQGRTWVNFWGTWTGTLSETGKKVTIPIHITSQFINGKIVREYGYWDATEVAMELQKIEAMKNASSNEQNINQLNQ